MRRPFEVGDHQRCVGRAHGVEHGLVDPQDLGMRRVSRLAHRRRHPGHPARLGFCDYAATLCAPIHDHVRIDLVGVTVRVEPVDRMRNVVVDRARECNARGDCPLVGSHEIELRLDLESDVIQPRAAARPKRTRNVHQADVVMGVAVAEESSLDQRLAIALLESGDVMVERHRAFDITDVEIDVAEPPRTEELFMPLLRGTDGGGTLHFAIGDGTGRWTTDGEAARQR